MLEVGTYDDDQLNKVWLVLNDVAGHSIFYDIHSIFLRLQSLFVLVVALDKELADEAKPLFAERGKNPIPTVLKSFVVYEFTCSGCNSRYFGETSRHFSTRIKEHTLIDRNSHVFKHLHNCTNCKKHYTPNCFKILDSAKTTYTLKLKEAFHIQNRKPKLKT